MPYRFSTAQCYGGNSQLRFSLLRWRDLVAKGDKTSQYNWPLASVTPSISLLSYNLSFLIYHQDHTLTNMKIDSSYACNNGQDQKHWWQCWRGIEVKGTLHCWWKCKLVQPLWMLVWWFLRKLGNNFHHDPAIPLLGTYPKVLNFTTRTGDQTMLIVALFVIFRTWKQPKCSLTEE